MRSLVLTLLVILTCTSATAQVGEWEDKFAQKKVSLYIEDVVTTDSSIIVAGRINSIGRLDVASVAEWNGNSWRSFSKTLFPNFRSEVEDICRDSAGGIYFYGMASINDARTFGMYKWTNSQLTQLLPKVLPDSRSNGKPIWAGGKEQLIVAGADGNLMRSRPGGWDTLGTFCRIEADTCAPITSRPIIDIASVGDSIFVLTSVNSINGVPSDRIALFDGQKWASIGMPETWNNTKLEFAGNKLFLSGPFQSVNGVATKHAAIWDGKTWSSIDPNVSTAQFKVAGQPTSYTAASDGTLFIAAPISDAKDSVVAWLGRWDGMSWRPIFGCTVDTRRIFKFKNDIYAHNDTQVYVLKDDRMETFGFDQRPYLGITASVNSLAAQGDTLWATGILPEYVDAPFTQVGYLRDQSWEQGIASFVNHDETYNTLASGFGRLYFGGRFQDYQGKVVNSLVQKVGNEWQGLGLGLTVGNPATDLANVKRIYPTQDGAIVSGEFTYAGGKRAEALARWDGSEWHSYDSSQRPLTNAIFTFRDTLLVGAVRDYSTDQELRLSYWDGETFRSWRNLSMNNNVTAIEQYGQGFVIGGLFDTIDGQYMRGVAYWNGDKFLRLDTGVSPSIHAIAVNGNEIYVAGREVFSRWDGTKWHEMDSLPANKEYSDLQIIGSKLFVSGRFFDLNGIPSHNIGAIEIEVKADVRQSEYAIAEYSVYPNPSSGIVRLEGLSIPRNVTIMNMLGQTVMDISRLTSYDIDVSNLSVGSYMIRIESDKGKTSTIPLQIVR